MMPLRSQLLFRKVTIIGVGLIGGSLGKALKKRRMAREVVGVFHQQATLDKAVKEQAVDQGFTDLRRALNNTDLVVLASPVSHINEMLVKIGPHIRRNCIVTDVGSTKSSIVKTAHGLPGHQFFVGSHPLAGSEKRGVENSNADLFENSLCIMTPTNSTHRIATERIKRLWTGVGAKVKTLSPEEHDKILAYVSHLPHLLAYGLIDAVPSNYLEFAAQGFKDTTRIAGSSPQMWTDICMENSKNILHSIDDLTKKLAVLRKLLISHNPNKLTEQFKSAKDKRDSLQSNG